jgi:uncharacterized protein DUF481
MKGSMRFPPVIALGLLFASAVHAQTPSSSGGCAGSPAGLDGFKLAKAGASVAVLQATQEQRTVSSQLLALYNWNASSNGAPTCGWPRQRSIVDLNASYDSKKSASGSLNITRNYSGKLQQQFFLASNASFAYALADLYSNNSLGIHLTQSYGGGVGYARGPFELDGDLRYIDENYLPAGDTHHLVGAGLSGRYDFSLDALLSAANLTATITAVPVFNESDAWFGDATIGLFLPFNGGVWGVTVIAEDNYVRNAPAGFRRNYFKATIGLAYSAK